jgi:hypothetical protein
MSNKMMLTMDLDGIGVDEEFLTNKGYMRLFNDGILAVLQMRRFGRSKYVYREAPLAESGMSVVTFVKTGSIVIHINEFFDKANIDVFVDKDFEFDRVLALTRQFFHPKSISTQMVRRV